MRTHFTIQDSKNVRNATKKMKKTLNANYKKSKRKIVDNLKYLSNDKQSFILNLLRKHEEMFDGILYNYTGSDYRIEYKECSKPYYAKPFPIPKIHEETPKIELNKLIKIDVLKRKNNSKWVTPTSTIS